jgi:NAD-dependent SIR2 family protein deacetylase
METQLASDPLDEAIIEMCWTQLCQAEQVIIAAGSGMSVDAGIDYTDTAYFARQFPAMTRRGFRSQYDLIGYQGWSEGLKWGYLAAHVDAVRFQTPPHPVYTELLNLVKQKNYFVITTNVDGMFARSGFNEARIFTPQGDYARYQCLKPCTTQTWPTRPLLERILPTINPGTQEITNPHVIPYCPNCGGPVFLNVRGGNWFVEEPYLEQGEYFSQWVDESETHSLLIIEIGSGFNTPGVIRWPMENITSQHPQAHLLRVNRDYPQIPTELLGKATALQTRGRAFIHALDAKHRQVQAE